MPPLVECTWGETETNAGANTYAFVRDRYNRAVAVIHNLADVEQLTSVVHYRVVPDIPAEFAEASAAQPENTQPPIDPAEAERLAAEEAETKRLNAEREAILAKEKAEAERLAAEAAARNNEIPVSPEIEAARRTLTRIHGIGAATAAKLNGHGFATVKQIADLDDPLIEMLEEQLQLNGRIKRDDWVNSAKRLVEEDDAAEAAFRANAATRTA